MNKNYHSPRTSNDIDMKLGLVTKLDEKNPATSKKLTITLKLDSHLPKTLWYLLD